VSSLGIVLASDETYAVYVQAAVASIRRHNVEVPIEIAVCGTVPALEDVAGRLGCALRSVPFPVGLRRVIADHDVPATWARFAKFDCMLESTSDPCLYLDADVIALVDVAAILAEAPLDARAVYMLLRRPAQPTLYRWRHAYLADAQELAPEAVATLLNEAFGLRLTVEEMLAIRCWNAGVICGSRAALERLVGLWRAMYLRMVTGPCRARFAPKDQLCLWLAAEQLKQEVEIRELPLAWNYMPGHTVPEEERQAWDAVTALARMRGMARVLHFGHTKAEPWAIELRKAYR
jgi:hypothetical protein